ncbi:MAG: hypothetical protein ABJE95_02000 [Byssovorax sp.]
MLAVFAIGLVAAVGGCPGSLDNKADFADAGFTSSGASGSTGTGSADPCGDVPAAILAAKCGGSGCHGTMSPQNGLDLESPGVAARVVDKPAKLCPGILADPSDPASSIIYTKLLATNVCSAQMPLARPPLSQKEIDCVKAWIGKQGSGTSSGASTGAGGAGGAGGATASQSSSSTG